MGQLLAQFASIEQAARNGQLAHAAVRLRVTAAEALRSWDAGLLPVASKVAINRAAAKAVRAFHRAMRERASQRSRRRADPALASGRDMNDETASVVIESVLLAMLPASLAASTVALMKTLVARVSIRPHWDTRWGDLSTAVRNAIARDVGSVVEGAVATIRIEPEPRFLH
jgi:hypothetical protein